MRRVLFIFTFSTLLIALACGDTRPPPAPERAVHPDDVPLVFIPGLMGSVLEDLVGERNWLSAGQALGFSTPDLSLPLDWDRNGALVTQGLDGLRPADALRKVEIFAGIGQEVYGPWIEMAEGFKHRPLHVFAYDWRRDNSESARLFENFLEKIQARYGGKKVQIVAHSMGGMITLSVLNRRPDLIDRAVFVGVPFRGGIGYLDNMFLGTEIALNDRLLGPDVIFSHTSVYSFYPAGADFENTGLVRDEQGKAIELDFYDVDVWEANAWGPFARESAGWHKNSFLQRAFLNEALKRSRAFRKEMRPTRASYPPALAITSKTHDTLRYIQRLPGPVHTEPGTDEDTRPRWDFENTARVPGDGSVTYEDTLPPAPIEHEVFLSDFSHSYLLSDPLVAERIEGFLR